MDNLKRVTGLLVVCLFLSLACQSQVSINTDNSSPDPSSGLEVKFPDRGFLPPRMSYSSLCSIQNPAPGLMVYCTDCGSAGSGALALFSGGSWIWFSGHCMTPLAPLPGEHSATFSQITWNWNAVPYATGYLWNTTNDTASALHLGNVVTKTETQLVCNTPYTRYLWAINGCGVSSPVMLSSATTACTGTCGQPFTDPRDGKVYPTVLIGTQCWFAKNMNVGNKISIYYDQANNGVLEKWCFNGLESNCDIYGGLYQWSETVQYLNGATNIASWNPVPTGNVVGICPPGWHIPADGEWATLVAFLGGETVAGGPMKEAGTTHWNEPNLGATNVSGFTGLPGGVRASGGMFDINSYGYFWAATQYSSNSAWYRSLLYDITDVYAEHLYSKSYGRSVRCLQNPPSSNP